LFEPISPWRRAILPGVTLGAYSAPLRRLLRDKYRDKGKSAMLKSFYNVRRERAGARGGLAQVSRAPAGRMKAFTILEVVIALALGAVISVGAFMMANWSLNEAAGTQARTEIVDLGSRIRDTFGHNPTYNSLTTARVVGAGLVRDSMRPSPTSTKIVHGLKGDVAVGGRSGDFLISAQLANQADCRSFMSGIVLGPGGLYGVAARAGSVTVASASVRSSSAPLGGTSAPRQPAPSDMAALCPAGARTAILFFR